jgi:hypothetical protein
MSNESQQAGEVNVQEMDMRCNQQVVRGTLLSLAGSTKHDRHCRIYEIVNLESSGMKICLTFQSICVSTVLTNEVEANLNWSARSQSAELYALTTRPAVTARTMLNLSTSTLTGVPIITTCSTMPSACAGVASST